MTSIGKKKDISSLVSGLCQENRITKKLYIKSNKNKLDSIETGHTVIPQTRVPSLPGLISMAQVNK